MEKKLTLIIALGWVIIANSVCVPHAGVTSIQATRPHIAKAFVSMAGREGITLDTTGLVILSSKEFYIVAASMSGMRNVPPTALPEGVDTMFIYYDGQGGGHAKGLRKGYYIINVKAQVTAMGTFDATAVFKDMAGKIRLTVETKIHVETYHGGRPERGERGTQIILSNGIDGHETGGRNRALPYVWVWPWLRFQCTDFSKWIWWYGIWPDNHWERNKTRREADATKDA